MNFKELIISSKSLDTIDQDRLRYNLEKYHFCILRDLISHDEVVNGMKKVYDFIESNEDNATTGENPDDVRGYFVKMSIGNARHGGVERPRFKRAIYSPLNKENKFELDNAFTQLAMVRNLLSNQKLDFALRKDEDGLWTAARMHQFPIGGGFMVSHKDTVLPKMLKDQKFTGGFFQPLALLSKKGEDFYKGGGFAVINNEILEYEEYTERGDIAIYDSLTEHGVADIDSDKKYIQRSGAGRYSGLVSLYKSL